MLATPVHDPSLQPGWAGEPKLSTGLLSVVHRELGLPARPRRLHGAVSDYQGVLALSVEAGTVVLRSRRGTDMGLVFREIVTAAGRLPDATVIDCVM